MKTTSKKAAAKFNSIVTGVVATGIVMSEFAHELADKPFVEASKADQLRELLTNTDRDAVEAILTELGLITAVATKAVTVSKSSLADAILDEEYARDVLRQRKDILARLMSECDMGTAYAGTKLQAYKTKHGLVNQK